MSDLPRHVLEDALDEYDDVTTLTTEERRSGGSDPAKVWAGRLRQVRRRRRLAVWSVVGWVVVATALLAGPTHGWWQMPPEGLVAFVVGSGVGLAFGVPRLVRVVRAEQLYELLQQVEESSGPAVPA